MPDRLPSLIVLAGFWIPPAFAGWVLARLRLRQLRERRRSVNVVWAAPFVVAAYAVCWFWFNLHRMPPYVPGAAVDPTYAPLEAAQWLMNFTALLIFPGSCLACWLPYRAKSVRMFPAKHKRPKYPYSAQCISRVLAR